MQEVNGFWDMLSRFIGGNAIYPLAGLGGLLYLCHMEKKERKLALLVFFILAISVFNPVSFKLLENYAVEYYRFLWLIPYPFSLVYFIYAAFQQIRAEQMQLAFVILLSAGIMIVSVPIQNLKLPDNAYQIPADTIEIAETVKLLENSRDTEYVTVLADEIVNNTIRQYNAAIRLPFNKYAIGGIDPTLCTETAEGLMSMLMYNRNDISSDAVCKIIMERNIKYIVINRNNNVSLAYMQQLGWQITAEASSYYVLQYQGND